MSTPVSASDSRPSSAHGSTKSDHPTGSRPASAHGSAKTDLLAGSRPASALGSARASQPAGSRPMSAKDQIAQGKTESRPDSAQSRDWTRRPLSKLQKPVILYEPMPEDMGLKEESLALAKEIDNLISSVNMAKRKVYSRDMRIAEYQQKKLEELKAAVLAKAAAKEAAKAAKKEAKRLENIKNKVMPQQKRPSDDDDEEEEEDEEEEAEEEGNEDANKVDPDAPIDLTEEEREKEKTGIEELELQLHTNLKTISSRIVSSRTDRNYTQDPEVMARTFLNEHYACMSDVNRDVYSLLPSFHPECEVNLGTGHTFKGGREAAAAVIMSCGNVPLQYDIQSIAPDRQWKKGLCGSFTVTVLISVDGDKPRRVMECYELRKAKNEKIQDAYIVYRLLTIVNDPRPLYLFADYKVVRTKNDNMEPWARALMPPTEEQLEEMRLLAEARETKEMGVEDELSASIVMAARKKMKADQSAAARAADAARKAALFADDEDGEEEEAPDEEAPDEEAPEEGAPDEPADDAQKTEE